jgi:hypothetical protein
VLTIRRRWLLSCWLLATLLICLSCTHPKPKPPTPPPTPEPTPIATPSPVPTPAPPPVRSFAFMFGGPDRYISEAQGIEDWPSAVYIWWGRDCPPNADDIPFPERYTACMLTKAEWAVQHHKDIILALGRERDIDPVVTLDAFKPYAQYIRRIDFGDECPSDTWPVERYEAEAVWIRGLMRERGYPDSIKIGSIFSQTQVLGIEWFSAQSKTASVASTSIGGLMGDEARLPMGHTLPPGWRSGPRMMSARSVLTAAGLDVVGLELLISASDLGDPVGAFKRQASAQFARVPEDKEIFAVVLGYTRNKSFPEDQTCVVYQLWPYAFELAQQDRRFWGWQVFSDGRDSGLRMTVAPACPGSYARLKELWEQYR